MLGAANRDGASLRHPHIHTSTHPHIHTTRYMYRNIWISLLQAYAAGPAGRRAALKLYWYLVPLKRGAVLVRTTRAGLVLAPRWLSVACAASAMYRHVQISSEVGGTWSNQRPLQAWREGLMGSSKFAIPKSPNRQPPASRAGFMGRLATESATSPASSS